MQEEKLLIVEGSSDRKRIQRILAEPLKIICTNGTISSYELEELLVPYDGWEIYVFMDADESGEKLRALFKREYPLAVHLYTEKVFKEVETTPYKVLTEILSKAKFKVRTDFLM
ncbi:toprim domain-containing protein [Sporosarcina sp. CAU 1771]